MNRSGGLPTRALSFRQPWAWLVVHGPKNVENRRWQRREPLGRFLVHASKVMTRREYDEAARYAAFEGDVALPPLEEIPLGGIVGVAEHRGETHMPWSERWDGVPWHMEGQFGYVLHDRRPLPFVPCKGALGLWRVPPAVLDELRSKL